jgi:DNA replication protein DnaC
MESNSRKSQPIQLGEILKGSSGKETHGERFREKFTPDNDERSAEDIVKDMIEKAKAEEVKLAPKLKWITDLNFQEIYQLFVEKLYSERGIEFKKDQDFEPIKAVLQYFIKDPNFFENRALRNDVSFDKGLLLIGNPGTLKTETLEAMAKIFNSMLAAAPRNTEKITLCCASSSVTTLGSMDKAGFYKTMDFLSSAPNLVIDDLKTERTLSNFGKYNIFDIVLHSRSKSGRNKKTFITMNYNGKCLCGLAKCKCGFNPRLDNDLEKGMAEVIVKYSHQVYSRLYQMCNIIEFNGEDKR